MRLSWNEIRAVESLLTKDDTTGEDIEGVLSVVLPESLKTGDLETVDRAAFRYATHYLDSKGESTRWPPERKWLEGDVDDLADAIEYLSLSERQLARGTEVLEQVVRNAAELLAMHDGTGACGSGATAPAHPVPSARSDASATRRRAGLPGASFEGRLFYPDKADTSTKAIMVEEVCHGETEKVLIGVQTRSGGFGQ